MKRVLITGANGAVGRRLIAQLVHQANHYPVKIMALDREAGTSSSDRFHEITWHTDDLGEMNLDAFFAEYEVDATIHLAAVIGQTAEDNPDNTNKLNFELTQELQQRTLQGKQPGRFIMASSVAAIGDVNGLATADEGIECNPISAYGRSKFLCESSIRSSNTEGLPAWALRLPTLMLRRTARRGSPTTGFVSDLAAQLIDHGHATSPMTRAYEVAVASFDEAAIALSRLLHESIPSSAPAVLNLPAFSVTPASIVATIREKKDCSVDYPSEDDSRISALTASWPKAMSSQYGDFLGIDSELDAQNRLARLIESAWR